MSRLTEKEIDLIRAARHESEPETVSAAHVVQKAQRLQSETLAELLTRAAAAVAKWTGLAALASAIDNAVLRELRGTLRRRAAVSELKRLDNHLLQDIGLERGNVEAYIEGLSTDEIEPVRSTPASTGGLRHWWQRRQAIRELDALDDRQLEDIGLVRSAIPAAVDRAMEKKARTARKVSAAQVQGLTQQALGATAPMQRRPADRTISSAKPQAPVLPLWIGPWLNLSQGDHVR